MYYLRDYYFLLLDIVKLGTQHLQYDIIIKNKFKDVYHEDALKDLKCRIILTRANLIDLSSKLDVLEENLEYEISSKDVKGH